MSQEAALSRKVHKKLNTAIAKSKHSKEGTRRAETSVATVKSHSKRKNGAKKSLKSALGSKRIGEEGQEMEQYKPVTADRRRKRVSAHEDINREKAFPKKGVKTVKGYSEEEKRKSRSVRSMWLSDGLENAASPIKRTSSNVKTVVKGSKKLNVKGVDKKDEPAESLLQRHDKTPRKGSIRNPDASSLTSSRKILQDKKGLNKDSGVPDDQPKKRKRIRLDPYDTSNKRLDDGPIVSDSIKEKKKDSEKITEMSKNAQFRAIQPSPSILSFVEDNLLGRRRSIELQRAGYNTELSVPLDNIPCSTSSERERIEENIFRNKLTFFAAANVSSSFPPPEIPEIAFAGRSNVGKSSLLNSLTRQWGVVRTSDKPGHTQTINFFKLGPKLSLVDLPGYGFAYAKEEVKEAWEELVKEYVSTRVGLRRVCLLIDTKWGMKPRDHELIDLMESSRTKYQIVLTKTDLVFPIDVARRAMQIEESLKANKSVVQPVMMVSSKSGAGIRCLRTVLAKIARFAKL